MAGGAVVVQQAAASMLGGAGLVEAAFDLAAHLMGGAEVA